MASPRQIVNYYFSFLSGMITAIIVLCTFLSVVLGLIFAAIKLYVGNQKGSRSNTLTIGFFHPYCNQGGGGERVLWTALKAVKERYKDVKCVVYTGDIESSANDIIERAKQRFNIILPQDIEFIYLTKRNLVEARMYPYFTLLGQSLGSVILGIEAILKLVPDIYIDTMGYPFTVPLFRYFGGCRSASYVHYPVISTDMLRKVSSRTDSHNNAEYIVRSPILSFCKLMYYHIFAALYGLVGRCNDVVMVNSSWTKGHIQALWKIPLAIFLLYPPCDVNDFLKLPLNSKKDSEKSTHSIVSVSQFRPEKDHKLQLMAFKLLTEKVQEGIVQLVLVGSCRNAEDEMRVKQLKQLSTSLGIANNVKFKLNITYDELKKCLCEATIGIHTMWNEHFGIGVVECMAAGLVMVAHDSGGPKLDIVTDHEGEKTGFLATNAEEYATHLSSILNMSEDSRLKIQEASRKSVMRFSDQVFVDNFLSIYNTFLKQ